MNIDSIPFEPKTTRLSTQSFGMRAAAFLIDGVAAGLANFVISLALGAALVYFLITSGQELKPDQISSNRWLESIVSAFVSLFYFVIFEGLYGATPGKLILSMRVVKGDGASVGFGSAFIRGILRLIDGFFFGVPAYFIMKPPLFQRLGDKAAGTIVVNSKDPIIKEHIDWWWFLIAAGVYTAIDLVVTLFILISEIP